VLEGPSDLLLEQELKFKFKISNNEVEYEAIIACLNLALDVEAKILIQKPKATKPIIIYLVVSEDAVNGTLVQKVEKDDLPIYFISRVLHSAEIRYKMIEKVVLALVMTTWRMCMYFQNHCIIVKTDYPIMKILEKSDLAGRMIGWVVELSEFHIQY